MDLLCKNVCGSEAKMDGKWIQSDFMWSTTWFGDKDTRFVSPTPHHYVKQIAELEDEQNGVEST
jgi:hypothetical protein